MDLQQFVAEMLPSSLHLKKTGTAGA
jgi:hypothetical protein